MKRCDEYAPSTLEQCIIDNIALEGLEGITLQTLCIYIAKFLKAQFPLPKKVMEATWSFMLENAEHLSFFILPIARERYKKYNRWTDLHEKFGIPIVRETCPYIDYKSVPIDDNEIRGSCEYYHEREVVPTEKLLNLSVYQVMKKWGRKFVIVASQELRSYILCPEDPRALDELTLQQYVMLESIARSRFNGETCAGQWSLMRHCNDATVVFYIKNKFQKSKMVEHYIFTEAYKDRVYNTSLLTLRRFLIHPETRDTLITHELIQLCSKSPDNTITLSKANQELHLGGSKKAADRLQESESFQQMFEIIKVPYQRVKPKPNSPEISNQVVKFKYPHLPPHYIFYMIHNEQDPNEFDIEPSLEYVHIGHHLRRNFYSAIYNEGAAGLSQLDLSNGLGMPRQLIRSIIRQHSKHKELSSYALDKGRQRIRMYTASTYTSKVKQSKDQLKKLNRIFCNPEPNIPTIKEPRLKDISYMKCEITPYIPEEDDFADVITERQILRRSNIIGTINENGLIQASYLRNIIQEKEQSLGIKDEVTNKSIFRLIYSLVNKKLLRAFNFTLKYRNIVREYRYITHPKINIDNQILKYEAIKLKNSLYLITHQREQREESLARLKAKRLQKEAQMKNKRMASVKTKTQITLKGTRPPRFLVARYVHEFIHYILVELSDHQSTYKVSVDLLQEWQKSSPDLNVNEFWKDWNEEEKPVYSKVLSWRTFIPPIHKYENKPVGWLYLMDAFDRIPLSLLNKIYRVEKNHDELLTKYLKHPVRQHYLMRQLPIDLKDRINRAQLTNIFIMVIKVLNNMGLVQVGERLGVRDPLRMWIYLNRYTELMDTSTTKPSYSRIDTSKEYPVLKFEFLTGHEINQYWLTLRHICGKTQLGIRRDQSQETEYVAQINFIGTVDFDEAKINDNGEVPGNRLGAAGLSSKMFAHLARNWSWVLSSSTTLCNTRNRAVKLVSQVQTNEKEPVKLQKKEKTVKELMKRVTAEEAARKKSIAKYGPRDDIDREALRNMRTLRVTWTPEEDAILKIARTVYAYVAAPITTIGLLTVGKICRDIIRRSLGYNNKTSQACSRRMQFIVRTKRHLPEIPAWLHALKTNEKVQQTYGESFLNRLKEVYPNRDQLCDALTLHFIMLIHLLYDIVHSEGESVAMPKFCIPDTISEFNRKYTLKDDEVDDKEFTLSNPINETEVQIAVANSTLHSSLCSARDKTSYNLQAFEIYKNYSEDILHKAFQKARSESLCVALKRKHIQESPTHLIGPAYLLSSRYKARLISLPIPYNVYSTFYEYFKLAIQTLYSKDPMDSKITMQLKSPHWGHLVFISEGLVRNFWKLELKLPNNILTVDLEQRNVISATDRIMDHYSNILDNAPTTEYTKQLDIENNDKECRVKFYPANLSYKMYYAPYDYIAKLPKRYLHFFCALNSLNRRVDLNFRKLLRKDDDYDYVDIECPFTCILNSENYINLIERIVKDNSEIIDKLQNMTPDELLSNNPSTSKSNTVLVQQENVMAIVNLFESFARKQDAPYDRRDLGKLHPNLVANEVVNWQALCQEIVEYDATDMDQDKIDELEPTLHKEERLVRAQEVFVVNLPTLAFDISDEFKTAKKQVMFHGQNIPRKLIEPDLKRKKILAKVMNESHWKYTENTFDTLKPLLNKLHFTSMEQKQMKEIHDHIEANQLGVTAVELVEKYSNKENFLARCLKILSEHYLIKRVGVATFMYVHRIHIRKWIVHTFHVTRLQNENQGGASKRFLTLNDDKDDPAAKTIKISNAAEVTGKRVSKPVKRFIETSRWDVSKTEQPKDIICMRPQPWIRLNGSLNRRVLDRWMGSILTECIARCGCNMFSICAQFPHLNPVDLMFLLEILSEIGCIHLKEIKSVKPSLLSEYEPIEEVIVTDLYNPEYTYITVHADALSRMAIFIGDKEYTTEFI